MSELIIEDVLAGSGDTASAGQYVSVHYTGWLTNGQKFDSSVDRTDPFEFKLGMGQVIPGWDQGVAGMQVGGKRKLTIPPELTNKTHKTNNENPPNTTQEFEVE